MLAGELPGECTLEPELMRRALGRLQAQFDMGSVAQRGRPRHAASSMRWRKRVLEAAGEGT